MGAVPRLLEEYAEIERQAHQYVDNAVATAKYGMLSSQDLFLAYVAGAGCSPCTQCGRVHRSDTQTICEICAGGSWR